MQILFGPAVMEILTKIGPSAGHELSGPGGQPSFLVSFVPVIMNPLVRMGLVRAEGVAGVTTRALGHNPAGFAGVESAHFCGGFGMGELHIPAVGQAFAAFHATVRRFLQRQKSDGHVHFGDNRRFYRVYNDLVDADVSNVLFFYRIKPDA